MDPQVRIENGELICLKDNHNEQIMMVAMETQIPFSERLLCSKCFRSQRQVSKYLNIDEVKKLIEEKQGFQRLTVEQDKQRYLQNLQEFRDTTTNLRSRVLQQLDEILAVTNQWIFDISRIEVKPNIETFVQDLKLIFSNQQIENLNLLERSNKSHFQKMFLCFKKLLIVEDFKKCFESFKQIQDKISINSQRVIKSPVQKSNLGSQKKEIKVQFSSIIKQNEQATAITFNYSGSLMFTGCDKDVKIWKQDQKSYTQLTRLKGHKNLIFSLVASKYTNWFASGSADSTIICWKEKNQEWISSQPAQLHTQEVSCLLLTKNEKQLISCAFDTLIQVWKLDINSNSLVHDYQLEERHISSVYCMSLNQSETYLVSCGNDQSIVLWEKGSKEKWVYKHHLITNDYGFRIQFIQNNFIVWLQQAPGILLVIEIQKGQMVGRENQTVQLNDLESDGSGLFPILINSQRQILIVKHNRYVYLMKMSNNDGKLTLLKETINCGNEQIFGGLSQNGENLVIWQEAQKELRIYKIQYP